MIALSLPLTLVPACWNPSIPPNPRPLSRSHGLHVPKDLKMVSPISNFFGHRWHNQFGCHSLIGLVISFPCLHHLELPREGVMALGGQCQRDKHLSLWTVWAILPLNSNRNSADDLRAQHLPKVFLVVSLQGSKDGCDEPQQSRLISHPTSTLTLLEDLMSPALYCVGSSLLPGGLPLLSLCLQPSVPALELEMNSLWYYDLCPFVCWPAFLNLLVSHPVQQSQLFQFWPQKESSELKSWAIRSNAKILLDKGEAEFP